MSTTFEFGTRDVFDIEDITLGSDFADPFM